MPFTTPQAKDPKPNQPEPNMALANAAPQIHEAYLEATGEVYEEEPLEIDQDDQDFDGNDSDLNDDQDLALSGLDSDQQMLSGIYEEIMGGGDDDQGPPPMISAPNVNANNNNGNDDINDVNDVPLLTLNNLNNAPPQDHLSVPQEPLLSSNVNEDVESSPLLDDPVLDKIAKSLNGMQSQATLTNIAKAIQEREQDQGPFVYAITKMNGGMDALDAVVRGSNDVELIKTILTHVYGFESQQSSKEVKEYSKLGLNTFYTKGYWLGKKKTENYEAPPIETEWDAGALKRLWASLRTVPTSHVRGTTKRLELDKKSQGGMFKGGGTIQVSHASAWRNIGTSEQKLKGFRGKRGAFLGGKWLMHNSPYSRRARAKPYLHSVILHEVGHAVDHKLGIMNRFGARPECGEWKDEAAGPDLVKNLLKHWTKTPDTSSVESDPDVVSKHTAYQTARTTHQTQKQNYRGAKIAKDQAMEPYYNAEQARQKEYQTEVDKKTNAIFEPATGFPGGKALEELLVSLSQGKKLGASLNEVMTEYPHAFENGSRKHYLRKAEEHDLVRVVMDGYELFGWNRTRSRLNELGENLGGRAFHRHNDKGDWVSYKISAKEHGVSHYQFRAPGEWFAELYANFYMDTLSSDNPEEATHPLYKWFKENIAKDIETLKANEIKEPVFASNAAQQVSSGASDDVVEE